MSRYMAPSGWGGAGKPIKLACIRTACRFRTERLSVDDGYGLCPRCQATLMRQQPRFAELRRQKAAEDLRSQEHG